jgi:hypothetical protein
LGLRRRFGPARLVRTTLPAAFRHTGPTDMTGIGVVEGKCTEISPSPLLALSPLADLARFLLSPLSGADNWRLAARRRDDPSSSSMLSSSWLSSSSGSKSSVPTDTEQPATGARSGDLKSEGLTMKG